MTEQITDFGDFGYEIHKNGHFWKTYIYRKDTELNYELVNTIRTLLEPQVEMIFGKIE